MSFQDEVTYRLLVIIHIKTLTNKGITRGWEGRDEFNILDVFLKDKKEISQHRKPQACTFYL